MGGGYDGFISYSHAADERLAPALQGALQRYAKPWHRRHSLRIFRDETGLTANPHLWSSIAEALDASRFFILLSSPDAAQSDWVGREIRHWIERNGVGHILPVVTAGRWAWDETENDFDWTQSTAVHPELARVFGGEPRHVDMTWARSTLQLDPRDGRFLDAVAELAAPMHGVSKDELAGEEVRQHKRTMRIAWSAITVMAALLVVAMVASIVALGQRNDARRQRVEADRQTVIARSRSLAAEAVAQAPFSLDRSLLLGVEAVRHHRSPETVTGLLTALNAASDLVGYRRDFAAGVADLALSPDRRTLAVVHEDGLVRLHDVESSEVSSEARVDGLGLLQFVYYQSDGLRLQVVGEKGAQLFEVPTLRPVGETVAPASESGLAITSFSPDGRLVASGTRGGADVVVNDVLSGARVSRAVFPCGLYSIGWLPAGDAFALTCAGVNLAIVEAATGSVRTQTADIGTEPGANSIEFSADGRRVVALGFDGVTIYDTATLRPISADITTRAGRPYVTKFSPDGRLLAIGGDDGSVLIWDIEEQRRAAELVGLEVGVIGLGFVTGAVDDGVVAARLFVATPKAVSEWDLLSAPPLAASVGAGGRILAIGSSGLRYEAMDRQVVRVLGMDSLVDSEIELPSPATGAWPSPDDRLVVIARESDGGIADAVHELYRVADGALVAELPSIGGTRPADTTWKFSPDGERLAALDPLGTAVVLRASDGSVLHRGLLERNAYSLTWSPDGSRLVTGGLTGTVRTWAPADGFRLDLDIQVSNNFSISNVERTGRGDELVVTSESGEVRIIDATTGSTVQGPFTLSGSQLRSGVMSPDGRLVAAISRSGELRLWDVSTNVPLGPPLRGLDRGDAADLVFIAPDVLALRDARTGHAQTWRIDMDHWIDLACRLASRQLSLDEWRRYLPDESFAPAC